MRSLAIAIRIKRKEITNEIALTVAEGGLVKVLHVLADFVRQ